MIRHIGWSGSAGRHVVQRKGARAMELVCPVCSETLSVTEAQASRGEADCPRCGSTFDTAYATAIDSLEAWRCFSQMDAAGAGATAPPPGAPAPHELPQLAGYDVQAFVARGGCGVVIKARHQALDRAVAIKLPLPGRISTPVERERFLREARSAARLRHPNICPIYEVGQYRDQPYIAMGYIDGPTLRDWAKAARPTARQAAEKLALLARAVAHAHRHGVVHRDIKPTNVMIDAETGQPVLTDFGLAKELADGDPHVTRAGQIMGTPAYMAPEQAAGRIDQIGPHTDVYALGAVLFELLCGRPPFLGSAGEIYRKVQSDEPPRPRQLATRVHRDLETICLRALAKRPADRYASAEAMADDLERFSAGEPILARRQGPVGRLLRRARRNPVAAAALAASLAGVAVGAYFAQRWVQARRVAAASQSFEDMLERADWQEGELAAMDAALVRMDRLAPSHAAEGRLRLNQRFAAHVRAEIFRPMLSEADLAHIESGIDLLARRDGRAAAALRQALAERRGGWQSVFDLAPPFADLAAVLDAAQVEATTSALRLRPARRGEQCPCILSIRPCSGGVQLAARFDESWRSAERLGVVLNAAEKAKGYAFVVAAGEAAKQAAGPTFAQAASTGGQALVQVFRDGVLLRQAPLALADIGHGGLELSATREGDRLVLQVNRLEPVVFLDVLPLRTDAPGVFGVLWPRQARLTRLRAATRKLPARPSPLERGHDLYAREQFGEALEQYRLQANQSDEQAVRQEARYRQGLCLSALKRTDEAQRAFEDVAAAAGERWPALGACQLWRIHLRARRPREAEAAFGNLAGRYAFQQLAMLLGEEDRREILTFYRNQAVGLGLLQFRPSRPEDLRRVVAVYDLLGGLKSAEKDGARFQLMRACSAGGLYDEAESVGRQLLDSRSSWGPQVCEEYCWLLRLRGQPGRALSEVNRRYLESRSPGWEALLVERARIHAAMGRPDLAEKDVDEFLSLPDIGRLPIWYANYSGACLIKGFLRKRAGDDSGAVTAWRRGYVRQEGGGAAERQTYLAEAGTGVMTLHCALLGSLSGAMSRADAEAMVARAAAATGDESINLFLKVVRVPDAAYAAIQTMCGTSRGLEVARRAAFRELSVCDMGRLPAILVTWRFACHEAFGDTAAAEDDELVWRTAEMGATLFVEGKLNVFQLSQLALAWKGTSGMLGWGSVAAMLDKDFRGPAAYMLAHRYLKLGRPQEAAGFLRTAVADSPGGSVLRRLAERRLNAIAPRGGVRPGSRPAGR